MAAHEVVELVGIDWVERRLNRGRSTIDRYLRAGRLAAPTWIGSRRCWTVSQIEAFVAAEQDRHRKFNLPPHATDAGAP